MTYPLRPPSPISSLRPVVKLAVERSDLRPNTGITSSTPFSLPPRYIDSISLAGSGLLEERRRNGGSQEGCGGGGGSVIYRCRVEAEQRGSGEVRPRATIWGQPRTTDFTRLSGGAYSRLLTEGFKKYAYISN